MSERIEELGGRWSERRVPAPVTKAAEAQRATGRDAEEWEPGLGHRVKKIKGKYVCVVCGEGWSEWPDAECTGPAGVAL